MPAATARALGVATRNVFAVLTDQEKADLGNQELDAVIKRFNNKRARDFNPSSLRNTAVAYIAPLIYSLIGAPTRRTSPSGPERTLARGEKERPLRLLVMTRHTPVLSQR